MEIARTSSFWRDVNELLVYFGKVQAESFAVRLMDAVDDTIDSIEEFPDLGSLWESARPGREGTRSRLVIGFENYIVLYRRNGESISVLRVVDARRDLESVL